MEGFLWTQQLKKDPVHQKIMQTRDVFLDSDNFDPDDKKSITLKKISSTILLWSF